ncbi:hypothetical protein SAMN05421796_11015 [Chryseobacterium piscicola]|uniref:Uncharacterized protein n=1 Tax=Chryseobacterium piscicola TaxID=551459 RepID=A0A1N7NZK6_9FLAO|nr:hypothetical protein [Chryseobacterium piscicola]PQA92800.1 hypothetical protein B0A70_10470 [Chryseobacterium piscicola]SIT03760.1 hypothetical protein SAMN05421796_11015 [Chryseobacterium piscicola]
MRNINLIAFGTFGDPNGFTQTYFSGDPSNTVKAFDIRGSIRLFSNSSLYSIGKESNNGYNIISYAVYTYAKEPTSAREGSFIGSAILLKDKILDEGIIISNLNEFHTNLLAKFVENDTITVNHSDKFSVSKPKDFDKISINLKDVISNLNSFHTNKNLFVFCETSPEKLQIFFKKSIDLLNVYDTIYFTRSEEVATFVAQKGIFKFIQQVGDKKEFDQEIDKLEIERKQKITDAIAKFEKNKLQLEEEKNREIENRKKQIEQNQQKQSENQKKIEESKSDLSKLENLYKTFAGHISILMSNLHSGKTLDEVNNSYKQFEKEFNDEKRKLSSTNHVSSVSNPRSTSQVSPFSNPYEKPNYGNDDDDDGKNNFSKILTIISLVLNVLLIGGIIYLYFINSDNKKKLENAENIATSKEVIESNESDPVLVESKLNPIPNDVAKNKIEEIQNKLIDNSTKIDEVVKIVFEINKPIGDAYKYQKGDYEEYLIKENPSAFNSNKILINKDSLKKIPFYKDENLKTKSVNNTTSTK